MGLLPKYRHALFIFDVREVLTLLLIWCLFSLFTFTLGVHYAKKISTFSAFHSDVSISGVATVADQVPNRQELTEQAKGANQAIDEALNQSLHDEVTRTGIKLDTPHQVELPRETKSTQAGATSP
jgi:pseudouridine-5'-phosphate glycosidase